jgi:hypothetical protein
MELGERPHEIPVADTPAKQAFFDRAFARRSARDWTEG